MCPTAPAPVNQGVAIVDHGQMDAPPCGPTGLTHCCKAHSHQSVRAGGERIEPLHVQTGVSQLHTIHPRPSLHFLQACMQVTRKTSDHLTCKLNLRHHVPCTGACVFVVYAGTNKRHHHHTSPRELSTHTLVYIHR